MKILFSREAVNDLKRLRKFIAIHNPTAANKIAHRLRNAIKRLLEFPLLGIKKKNNLGILLRELIINNYIICYTIADDTIYILQIWYGKENRRISTAEEAFTIKSDFDEPLKDFSEYSE